MRQNFFTPFGDDFKADNYIILIFSQFFFVHIACFPNLEDNSARLKKKNRNVMDILGSIQN
jgi:hypothetical protein